MSISSDDSLFDEDDNLLVNENEDIDYYAILNIPRDASTDDVNKAYKSRCLLFHPDRHIDEQAKKDAEKVFVVLRKAHETLGDPQKRAIYDAVGLRGLEMQGWQIVAKSNNVENIRQEYEFLKKLRETEIMIQRIHPTGNFQVKVNAAGLFCENEEERYMPSLVGLSISQGVDSALTSSDRVGLSGRVKSVNGRGDGQMAASWKRSITSTLHLEAVTAATLDSLTSTLKLSKSLSPKLLIAFAPQVQYVPSQGFIDLSASTTVSTFLTPSWQGSVAFNYGLRNTFISSTIMKTELNRPKFSVNLTLSPINSFVRTTYHKIYAEDEGQLDLSMQLSPFGVIPSVSYERKLSKYSKIACGVTVNYPACVLVGKFRLKTSLNHYELNIVLCESQDEIARSVVYGVALPYVIFQTCRVIFRKPLSKLNSIFDDSQVEQQVDEAKREDAQKVVNLMRSSAERVARQEEQKLGLIIVEAKYGQMEGGNAAYPLPGEKLIDVTVPLQAMVSDSQLRIFSVKSQLTGFYDPCPGEAKMLRVVYKFRDQLHAVVIPDELPLNIPLASHSVSQNKS